MKLKFGDRVEITKECFYQGAEGVIIEYNMIENRYEVQLDFNIKRGFYIEDLKKLRRILKCQDQQK